VAPGATPAAPVGLQVRNPGDLYLYSNNNLQAVKIKGSDLKAWLETAAKQFGNIDPTSAAEQDLVPDLRHDLQLRRLLCREQRPARPDRRHEGGWQPHRQPDVPGQAGGGHGRLHRRDQRLPRRRRRQLPGHRWQKTIIKSPDANQAGGQQLPPATGQDHRQGDPRPEQRQRPQLELRQGRHQGSGDPSLHARQRSPWQVLPGSASVTAEGALDASGFAKYAIDL
jgi:2',3'-cyclic-nucleotide 2'-phosphodiesterase/3'-nucleotidase